MKTLSKIFAVATVVTFGAFQVNAQGLYINAGLGYGMAAGKMMLGSNITEGSTTTSEEGV
jgi:small neutral amino acid transporter SnatA (MarC family)